MIIKVSRNSDPFKKYWWVLLVVLGVLAVVACLPSLNGSSGGGVADSAAGEGGLRTADGGGSLDPTANPDGAPGGAVDLSMDGALGHHRGEEQIMSSLYQAPGGADLASSGGKTSPGAGGAGKKKLADALRDITRRSAASASVDPRGWGGEKAQRGFTAPAANFGSLPGLDAASGSSGGTSFSGTVGDSGLTGGGFGNFHAQTGTALTRGLGDDQQDIAQGRSANAALASLKTVSNAQNAAARQNVADLASAMSARSFDGSSAGGSMIGGGGGASDAAGGIDSLAAAPANLKANDPHLDSFKFDAAPAPVKMDNKDDSKKQLEQAILMAVVTGLVGACFGGVGAAVMGPVMSTMMQNSSNTQKQSQDNAANEAAKNT